MNESETRAELIDPALTALGWGVLEGSRVAREFQITAGRLEGLGKRGKAEKADYVLIYHFSIVEQCIKRMAFHGSKINVPKCDFAKSKNTIFRLVC